MKCAGCERRARPRDLFCSNKCGHTFALELLATDDTRVCPTCRKVVGTSGDEGRERCDECQRDVSKAPTSYDRVFGELDLYVKRTA